MGALSLKFSFAFKWKVVGGRRARPRWARPRTRIGVLPVIAFLASRGFVWFLTEKLSILLLLRWYSLFGGTV